VVKLSAIQTQERLEEAHGHVARWIPVVLRWTAGLLWLSNVSWKIPTAFGKVGTRCDGFCHFVELGADHPVLPGSAWLFQHVLLKFLTPFGWAVLLVEALLAACFLSGRFVRLAAVVGVAQSLGILASVANAPNEWFWSYILMIVLHLALLATFIKNLQPSARSVAVAVALYGVAVALSHVGGGFSGDRNTTWSLFSGNNDIPDEFGKNVFVGSIALGLLVVALAVVVWLVAARFDVNRTRVPGFVLFALGVILLLTDRMQGLAIGLGSGAPTASVIMALGLALAIPAERILEAGGHVSELRQEAHESVVHPPGHT